MSDAWLPIETAPRDGTSILLHDRLVGAIIGLWNDGNWIVSWDHDDIQDQDDLTHWQPLPAPPKDAEA